MVNNPKSNEDALRYSKLFKFIYCKYTSHSVHLGVWIVTQGSRFLEGICKLKVHLPQLLRVEVERKSASTRHTFIELIIQSQTWKKMITCCYCFACYFSW